MKIIAQSNKTTFLVEMTVDEISKIIGWYNKSAKVQSDFNIGNYDCLGMSYSLTDLWIDATETVQAYANLTKELMTVENRCERLRQIIEKANNNNNKENNK